MRVGRILDVFCAPGSSAVVDALMHGALERFRNQGTAFVSCVGLHPKIRKRAQRYLYLRPSRLDRPAWMLWKGSAELQGLVYDERKWHLSHADSDIGLRP